LNWEGGTLRWTNAELHRLLAPKSIAVVGASSRSGPGLQVLSNLDALGFTGEILPINPKYDTVANRPCYPSLSKAIAAVGEIEAVAILVGRDSVLPVLEDVASVGIQAAWAFASGFSEADAHGRMLQEKVAEFCVKHRIALCGPNCVGIVNPAASSAMFSPPLPTRTPEGDISFVSQSGSICLAMLNGAGEIGFHAVVSSGNEAVIDSTDYLEYFVEDPGTNVLTAFIEEFRDPERFREVASKAQQAGKPLIVLKVGKSEVARQATVAHTGAVAGADDVYDAVFRKHGVLRVSDLNELTQTAKAFSLLGEATVMGTDVGMLTLSGGAISLAADLAEDVGLRFPEWSREAANVFRSELPPYAAIANPLDAWGSGRIEHTYDACIAAAAADEKDVIVLAQDAPLGMSADQRSQFSIVARSAARVRQTTGRPIVALSHLGGALDPKLRDLFESGGIPLLQGTREGLRAVRHLAAFGCAQQKGESARIPTDHRKAFLALRNKGVLDEVESKTFLASAGIPCVKEIVCASAAQATEAADALGYPVVLKGISPAAPHKSDLGLVALNLQDSAAVQLAAAAVQHRLQDLQLEESRIVVQQMVSDVVAELLVGVASDPAFGLYVTVGIGGRWVEIERERSMGIPPLSAEEALAMIEQLKGGRLIHSARGLRQGDVDSLVNVLLCMGDLAASAPKSILAMEINPLLVLPNGEGVVAADALIEIGDEARQKGLCE
jgi:acyl-CoA synthetase (NDP forming)